MNIVILYSANHGLKTYRDNFSLKISENMTIFDKQVKLLKKIFKSSKISIISKPQNKKIAIDNINIIENSIFETTNCLYNLSLLNIKSSLLVVPGNVLFADSFLRDFDKSKSSIWIMKEYNDIGCIINENKISNMMFGLDNYWSGVVYFSGNEIKLLKEIVSKTYINRWHLFEGINWIIEKGGTFNVIKKKTKVKIINRNKNV